MLAHPRSTCLGIAGLGILLVPVARKAPGLLRGMPGMARAVAAAERRRLARDLHDGIAQDLALIATHGDELAGVLGSEHPVVIAARRALVATRSTIAELEDPAGITAAQALAGAARELAARFAVTIKVAVAPGLVLDSEQRHHLTRILREAVTNSVRHGGARNIAVEVTGDGSGTRMTVSDDGRAAGPPGSAVREGFGMRSMRERAAELGGALALRRLPSGSSELEVVVR